MLYLLGVAILYIYACIHIQVEYSKHLFCIILLTLLILYLQVTLTKACNLSASDSDYVDQLLCTYEALEMLNLSSSQAYCSERLEKLFCNASMECNDEPCVKDLICQQMQRENCTEIYEETKWLFDCKENGETGMLNCSDQFDLANNGSVCLPLCGEFSQYSETYTTPHIIILATSLFIGIVGGITVIVVSFRKRKKM